MALLMDDHLQNNKKPNLAEFMKANAFDVAADKRRSKIESVEDIESYIIDEIGGENAD